MKVAIDRLLPLRCRRVQSPKDAGKVAAVSPEQSSVVRGLQAADAVHIGIAEAHSGEMLKHGIEGADATHSGEVEFRSVGRRLGPRTHLDLPVYNRERPRLLLGLDLAMLPCHDVAIAAPLEPEPVPALACRQTKPQDESQTTCNGLAAMADLPKPAALFNDTGERAP